MTENEFVERCAILYVENFESTKKEAIDIALNRSFYEALDYLVEEVMVSEEIFVEAFLEIDSETVRKLMYQKLLDYPCINWLAIFIEQEEIRLKKRVSNPHHIISNFIYKNYSKEEIVKKLSDGLYDVYFEHESFPLLEKKLAYILHSSELVSIWKNVLQKYIDAIYCENDFLAFFSEAEKITKGTVGYYVLFDVLNQYYEKFIPYLNLISPDSSIGNFILHKIKTKK